MCTGKPPSVPSISSNISLNTFHWTPVPLSTSIPYYCLSILTYISTKFGNITLQKSLWLATQLCIRCWSSDPGLLPPMHTKQSHFPWILPLESVAEVLQTLWRNLMEIPTMSTIFGKGFGGAGDIGIRSLGIYGGLDNTQILVAFPDHYCIGPK